MRRTIASPRAPKAIGPYSQAVVTHHADDIQMLHAAGQIPIDPATGELVVGDIAAQAERVMENIAAVLVHAGMEFSDVVKTTVFLVDLADFAAMNEVYGRRFTGRVPGPVHHPGGGAAQGVAHRGRGARGQASRSAALRAAQGPRLSPARKQAKKPARKAREAGREAKGRPPQGALRRARYRIKPCRSSL